MQKKWFQVLATVVFIGLFSACSSAPKRTDGDLFNGESHVEDATPQEAKEFAAIEATYKVKNFEEVLKKTKAFIGKHPHSVILDQVYFIRGLAYLGQEQKPQSLINFKHVVDFTKSEIIRNMALYNKALVEFEQSSFSEARASLEAVNLNKLSNTDKSKYYILLAKVEKERNEPLGATRAILSAIRYHDASGSQQTFNSMQSFLKEFAEKINNVPQLEKLVEEFADVPGIDHVYYRIASLSETSGDKDTSKAYYGKIMSDFPQSSYYPLARDSLTRSATSDRADGRKVGVLLTLSGKFSKYGYKALQGIQLAFDIFPGKDRSGGLGLVIADDKGEEATAIHELENLVNNHGVIAVIGPLVSKLTDAVARRAQELGVTLITLSQKEGQAGNYIFNAALTPSMQIREVLRIAKEMGKINRLAIMAPSSKFGEEYSYTFWDEAVESKFQLAGFEFYSDGETDFRSAVDNLVGLSFADARGPEVAELNELKAASQLKLSNKRMNKVFSLKPIVDFDAVFIPDSPKALGQILPTFAYRDAEKVQFFGINTWNSNELISRAGRYAEGAIFVDAYYPGSEIPSAKFFETKFQETFGVSPTSLEAMAYDAANILHVTLSEHDVTSRSSLRSLLTNLSDFPGIMGKISYSNGKLTKRLAVLTVKGGKIEEIVVK